MAMEPQEPLLNTYTPAVEPEPRSRKSTYHGLNLAEHDLRYGRLPKAVASWRNLYEKLVSCCAAKSLAKSLLHKVPVVDLFRTYKFKKYVIGDIIAGLSVGIVNIPQSLGYAKLADVPVIMGLYTSVFPVLIYFIFGSSRHVSMGTMALCSLVIAEAIKKHGFQQQTFSYNETTTSDDFASGFTLEETQRISVAVSVSFLAGIFLVLMSIFHLGFIVSFMAEPFVSGYLAANSLRILTHQVRDMLGVSPLKGYSGPGDYFYLVFGIFYNLPNANLIQILISALSIAALVLVKKCINERFAKRIRVPIPIDIIVVILFTLASHFGQLEDKFGVKILKTIPKGIPAVTIPSVELMQSMIFDSLMLAIVAYMMVGMMAKLFSQRHNYPVDNTQELLANGLSCMGGAFFCCLAPSSSPPRCFLMETTGGHTQIAYVISGLLALLSVLVIAPLFQPLPVCVLSSIIFVALMPLFPHFIAWLGYWRTNKYDFAIWVVTAVITIIFSVDIGLLVGIGLSLIVMHFRMQHPATSKLAVNEDDVILLDSKYYSKCHLKEKIAIFRFESPIYFATLDVFKEQLFKHTISLSFLKSQATNAGIHIMPLPTIVITEAEIQLESAEDGNSPSETVIQNASNNWEQKCTDIECGEDNGNAACMKQDCHREDDVAPESQTDRQLPNIIAVDCSAIPFLDTSGAKMLAQLENEYSNFNVRFLLANCCNSVIQQLKAVDQCKNLITESVYPSMHDVIVAFDG